MLKILVALEDSWPLAKWLKLLIEGNKLDDKTLDALLNIFKSAVKNVADGVRKAKLEKSVVMLEKLKEIEAVSKEKDSEDIEELDAILDSF